MKYLLFLALALVGGCLGTVETYPSFPYECQRETAPRFRCEGEYYWAPGYYYRNRYFGPRYLPRFRGPRIRDHRR